MFDVHGRENCGGYDYYCGPAGEYFDIRYNSIIYDAGVGVQAARHPVDPRGRGAQRLPHGSLWSSTFDDGALDQTESGLVEWDNLTGVNESDNLGQCDFDGDGMHDKFFATGQTWWYSSAGTSHWIYLNTSTKRVSDVTLGDVDYDGKCDVVSGSMVSSGGTGPWRVLVAGILWQNASGQLATWTLDGGRVVSEAYPGLVDSTWQLKRTADFDGDGQSDILWQHATGQVAIWYMSRGARVAEGYPGGRVPASWRIQATGDFDGDGRSDILWRDDTGQLAIWFEGKLEDAVRPAAYPGYGDVAAPVDLAWEVKGAGDFDGDGRSDILWRHANGQVAIWNMAGGLRIGEGYPAARTRGSSGRSRASAISTATAAPTSSGATSPGSSRSGSRRRDPRGVSVLPERRRPRRPRVAGAGRRGLQRGRPRPTSCGAARTASSPSGSCPPARLWATRTRASWTRAGRSRGCSATCGSGSRRRVM